MFLGEIIVKRQHNTVRIAGLIQKKIQTRDVGWIGVIIFFSVAYATPKIKGDQDRILKGISDRVFTFFLVF